MPDYGNPSYWDERYAARGPTEQFDWYQNFGRLKNQLLQHVDQNAKEFEILVPGCGNSPLPGHLFDHGAKNLTCIDVSTVVVQQQTDRYKNFDTIEFLVGDCLNLDFIPVSSPGYFFCFGPAQPVEVRNMAKACTGAIG